MHPRLLQLRPPGYLAESARTGELTALAILDVDGTLVDSNYQHTLAWGRAFADAGVEVPLWKVHRHIGMGGDQLVGAVAGERVEHEAGERVRERQGERYQELIGEVRPLPGARELIQRLRSAGRVVVLASSAKQEELDHYLELLGARGFAHGWTSAADVEATKPEPDLVRAALAIGERHGWEPGDPAAMLGDSVWDIEAAKRADVPASAVLSGGFGERELRDAGAVAVYESVAELEEPAGLGAAA